MLEVLYITILAIIAGVTRSDLVALDDRESYDADDIPCEDSLHRVCLTGTTPQKFPENEEELERFCEFGISYLVCAVEYGGDCDAESLKYHMPYLKVLNEICRKDNRLHAAVVENLQCFSEIEKGGPNDECVRKLNSPEVAKYTEALEKEGLFETFDEDYVIENKKECTRELLEMACYAVKIETNCGRKAMNTFLKILKKLRKVLECAGSHDMIVAVVRRYKLEQMEALVTDDILRRKK